MTFPVLADTRAGLCACGCGQSTNLAVRTSTSKGWIKGQPVQWRKGHARNASQHRLNNINETDRIATCSICGPRTPVRVLRATDQKRCRWECNGVDRLDQRKNTRLIRHFGIALTDYRSILQDQDNRCLICACEATKDKPLVVDHCHATGRVRGLLCSNCNTGIGLLGDKAQNLQAALAYLEERQ